MASAFVVGVGAITAAVVGRQLYRSGYIGGKKLADEWAKGGFKAKMDRKEAVAILGLKYVYIPPCAYIRGAALNRICIGFAGKARK